jgi:type IV pilus assembly protein PilQ
LLQLELSALQAEGRGEVVSSPRVITANQKEAIIEAGTEIPYQEASSSGATAISFKKAVLSLRVTPRITPDDRIIMDLSVNKDSVGQIFAGVPSIDTNEVSTQVLVANGDTVVLGGIFESEHRDDVTSVPFFGDLPYLGRLFKNTLVDSTKQELLVFVTPKILKDSLSLSSR